MPKPGSSAWNPEQRIRDDQMARAQGACLARDRHRNLAPLKFDRLSSDIEKALETKPARDRNPTADVTDSDSRGTASNTSSVTEAFSGQDEAHLDPEDRALIDALEHA